MEAFCKRLKEERKLNGYSAKDMAEKLGIPLSTYKSYETPTVNRHQPSIETLVEIAKLLDVSLDYLLGVDTF